MAEQSKKKGSHGNEIVLKQKLASGLCGIVTGCVYSPHCDRYAGFRRIKKDLKYDSAILSCKNYKIYLLQLLQAKNTLHTQLLSRVSACFEFKHL